MKWKKKTDKKGWISTNPLRVSFGCEKILFPHLVLSFVFAERTRRQNFTPSILPRFRTPNYLLSLFLGGNLKSQTILLCSSPVWPRLGRVTPLFLFLPLQKSKGGAAAAADSVPRRSVRLTSKKKVPSFSAKIIPISSLVDSSLLFDVRSQLGASLLTCRKKGEGKKGLLSQKN